MTPDVSRMFGRIADLITTLPLGPAWIAIRNDLDTAIRSAASIDDIPASARPLFEKHRATIMRGLSVPEHRP